MAYQTGTSTGETDLLAKIHTFSVANGFTSNRNTATDINISKGNLFQNIHIDGTGLFQMQAATSFSSGLAWNAQIGKALTTQKAYALTGAYTKYHFFTNAAGDYIHIVVEVDPGLFKHLGFGLLDKSSSYTGGEYSSVVGQEANRALNFYDNVFLFSGGDGVSGVGGEFNSTVRAQYDSITNPWLVIGNVSAYEFTERYAKGTDYSERYSSTFRYITDMFYEWKYWSVTTFNALTPLSPIYLYVERTSSKWSYIGAVKDLRNISLANYNPSQELTIGADTWIVFPVSKKGTSITTVNESETYGYAYKKIL